MHPPIPQLRFSRANRNTSRRIERGGGWPAASPGTRDGGVAARDQVAMPGQDRVGVYQQPQAPQCRPGQRVKQSGQQRPVGGLEPDALATEVALQHADLMAQREDFRVLVATTAG